ncbi:Boron transporter 1 [Morus notabilis]|uniref:Boron transporter 1 n=1 Tax=Morus notabilis TaxID=981085 RepID=W9SD35_9ROSA|nr:Boron transporter 1 [Morus notabilis]
MEEMFVPFQGIKNDLRGRLMKYYFSFWNDFGTTTCIFFASAIPDVSPLGVAEPTVTMYTFMFNIVNNIPGLGSELFLTLTRWYFSFLFLLIDEFHVPKRENPKAIKFQQLCGFANEMFALVLSFDLLLTALRSRKARSWRFRLLCIPPSNGVIPKSPMHTKSLATLKHRRPSNLLQAATVGGCVAALPFIKKIPNFSSLRLFCRHGHRKLTGQSILGKDSVALHISEQKTQDREMGRTASFEDDGEILDGMITQSRGEIRLICKKI